MKSKKSNIERDKPDVESDTYRLWSGDHVSAKDKKEMERTTLSIHEGERIHEVVVLDFGGVYAGKVLSKIRDRDGLINACVKVAMPTGKGIIIKCDAWITKEQYDDLVTSIKKQLGVHEVSVTSGEEIHTGIEYAMGLAKTKTAKGHTESSKPRDRSRDVR